MYPGALLYTLSLLMIAGLTGGIAFYAFWRAGEKTAWSFGWIMVAITQWVAVYAIEMLVPSLSAKLIADQLTFFGIGATPIFWLLFALYYAGFPAKYTDVVKILAILWPLFTLTMAFSNDFHHLMWRSASLDTVSPGLSFTGYGPVFWFIVAASYLMVLGSSALYVSVYLKSPAVFRNQIRLMILGSLIPLLGNAVYLSLDLDGLDPTPFLFAFSGILLSLAFFRYGLLNLTPLASSLVMENLSDAVLVVDLSGRLVDLNPAARKWLNTGEEVIGQDIRVVLKDMEALWARWDEQEYRAQLEVGDDSSRRWLQITVSTLKDQRGGPKGRVITARDITEEQQRLLVELRRARQIESLNAITHAALQSLTFGEILQILADQMGKILEADGAYITLWDDTVKSTIPAAAYGKLRDVYPTIRQSTNEQSLTESVLNAGHPLAVDDVFNSPYISHSIALRFPSRSILALPLIANNEKLGAALIAFNRPHHFTPEEISVGELVGPQIALALYKARLLDESYHRIAQLALLDDVSKRVADSLDEKQILERTVEVVVNRFGFAEAAISLLVSLDELEVAAINGTDDVGYRPGYRQKIGDGIIGYTAKTRLPYLANDIEQDPYYFTIGKRKGSALGVPMIDGGQLIGVLYVESVQQNAFNQDDLQTLQTLTSHVVTAIQKARLFEHAQGQLRALTTLQFVSQMVGSSLDLHEIFETVVHMLKNTFDYTYISIYLLEDQVLRLGAEVGYPESLIFYEIPVTSGVVGRTIATRQPQFIPDVTQDPAFLRASYEIQSEICVPLLKEGKVLGVINVEAAPGHPLTERDMDLIMALAGSVAIAVDNARLHAEVKSLALTDGLTGLFNRRAFDQVLETEVARAERYGHPLALIILDLDGFKLYNDRWGHPAGDMRLVELAKLLQSNVRSPDVAARYGGEEFAIILPFTSREGALALAERLRQAAEDQSAGAEKTGAFIAGYTISLGVATYPEDGRRSDQLLLSADNAELAAKRLGKNRVCVASDFSAAFDSK